MPHMESDTWRGAMVHGWASRAEGAAYLTVAVGRERRRNHCQHEGSNTGSEVLARADEWRGPSA